MIRNKLKFINGGLLIRPLLLVVKRPKEEITENKMLTKK
jgi:hypothetical protein